MTFFKNVLDWFRSFGRGTASSVPASADDPVPNSDHILRYIKPTATDNGTPNGSGFLKRPGEEGASVNWIEYFQGNLERQIEEIRKKARLDYAKTGVLARLNVGITCSHVLEKSKQEYNVEHNISVVQDPLPEDKENGHEEDPSHALVKGVPTVNEMHGEYIGDLIAQCVIDTFPARSDH